LTVHWIAHVLGALISVVAVDASTQHRVFTGASSTHAGKTAEVARDSIGYERIVTLAIRRVAGVGGALVLIIAVDVRAQHTATGSATACGTTGTGYPTGATRAAGAGAATSTGVAKRRRLTAGVGAVKEPVRVVVSTIFTVAWLGSFDARFSKVTSALTAAARTDHRDPQTRSACRNAPHRL
jgi:hypothetical protein